MSYVTDVLIVARSDEDAAIAHINTWLASREGNAARTEQLCEISTDTAGGYKWGSIRVWAAAFNYLDNEAMAGAVRAAPWEESASVAAYFRPEQSGAFMMSPARPELWELES